MEYKDIFHLIEEFCQTTHGSTDYGKDLTYVVGENNSQFAPLTYILKKFPQIQGIPDLNRMGFCYNSCDFVDSSPFPDWYEKQFSKKLPIPIQKKSTFLYYPNNDAIIDALSLIGKKYEVLKDQNILINSKNMPIQFGEWISKGIFGLRQEKSTSQRGFDFFKEDKRVEVKVHWTDLSSPKGVKIKRSLVELCDWCIIVYLAQNFCIRDICYLDSDFVLRKFNEKGHTIFLKDADVSNYFFSKSNKHYDKVVNMDLLKMYSTPNFMKKIESLLVK